MSSAAPVDIGPDEDERATARRADLGRQCLDSLRAGRTTTLRS
jgi:hypothetical protein